MFEGEGLVRVAYGEFLRFSLAIEMQRDRLALWREDLRHRREISREKSLEAIFTLPRGVDVEQHLRSIRTDSETPSLMHLKNEAHFLLVAVKNLDQMARVLRSAFRHDQETVRCIQVAITSFEDVAPEVTHLRNLHEHLDQLLRSRGDAFAKLPAPDLGSAIAILDDDVAYFIGGKVWAIGKLTDAASKLATSIRECVGARDARSGSSAPEG